MAMIVETIEAEDLRLNKELIHCAALATNSVAFRFDQGTKQVDDYAVYRVQRRTVQGDRSLEK